MRNPNNRGKKLITVKTPSLVDDKRWRRILCNKHLHSLMTSGGDVYFVTNTFTPYDKWWRRILCNKHLHSLMTSGGDVYFVTNTFTP